MSELSDFHIVQDADELAEPSAPNGTNGTYSANGHNRANGHYDTMSTADAWDGALADGSVPPPERAPEDSMVGADAVALGSAPDASKMLRRDTWGAELPLMRIGHASVSSPGIADAATRAMAAVPARVFDPYARTPLLLRPARLVSGLVILGVAWLATLGVLMLGANLVSGLPAGMDLPFQFGIYAVTALGAAWLALVALACLATGAFSLALALRARRW